MSDQNTPQTPFVGGPIKPAVLTPDAAKLAHAKETHKHMERRIIGATDTLRRMTGREHKAIPIPTAQEIASGKIPDSLLNITDRALLDLTIAHNAPKAPEPELTDEEKAAAKKAADDARQAETEAAAKKALENANDGGNGPADITATGTGEGQPATNAAPTGDTATGTGEGQ